MKKIHELHPYPLITYRNVFLFFPKKLWNSKIKKYETRWLEFSIIRTESEEIPWDGDLSDTYVKKTEYWD